VTTAERATNRPAASSLVGLGVVGPGLGVGAEEAGVGVVAEMAGADAGGVFAAAEAWVGAGSDEGAVTDGVRLGEPAATRPLPWLQPVRTTAASAATITARFGAIAPG
jgi:hypothetical protein